MSDESFDDFVRSGRHELSVTPNSKQLINEEEKAYTVAANEDTGNTSTIAGGVIRYLFEPLPDRVKAFIRITIIVCLGLIGLSFTASFTARQILDLINDLTAIFA